MSIKMGASNDHGVKEKEEGFIAEHIVLSKDNPFLKIWYPIYSISCLLSSFMYAWHGAFGSPEDTTAMWFFESLFLVTLFLNFITEYEEDGKSPTRDPSMIATHYLHGLFWIDFVPLLPF